MRNLDESPYSPEEARVAAFFAERGAGGGDDPVGSLLAGHAYVLAYRKRLRAALKTIADDPDTNAEAAVFARNALADDDLR